MIKLATVFSGIGAVEHALERMNVQHELVFASDNGGIDIWKGKTEEEKQTIISNLQKIEDFAERKKAVDDLYRATKKVNAVKESYFANYKLTEEQWHNDVTFLDGKPYKGKVDLFVGGSPCQSFSMVGKRGGLEDTRGTLFYEFARLVQEIQPKVFIYENVKGLLSHDKGNTWTICQNVFNQLGYTYYFKILNAKEHGIPQSRPRIFVVGFKDEVSFDFPEKIELTKKMKDFLDKKVDEKYYLSPKGIRSVTNEVSIKKKYTQINGDIAICQMAQQQFNLRGDFIYEGKDIKRIGPKSKVRKLLPKECLRLMGFKDSFKQVVSDTQMYRQAGNSIVVDVLIELMKEIEKTNVLEFKKELNE